MKNSRPTLLAILAVIFLTCVKPATASPDGANGGDAMLAAKVAAKGGPILDALLAEMERSKAQLKGSLMLSLESSTSRMSNLARQEMYFDRFYDLDELIARIEAVTAEDLTKLANEFFKTESVAVTALGNLNGLKLTRDQLAC